MVGQPLVDKFSRTTFATRAVNQHGQHTLNKQASPRIAILGPNTFSPDSRPQAAVADEPNNTVNHHVKRIEVSITFNCNCFAL
jgi:hypothetical protein